MHRPSSSLMSWMPSLQREKRYHIVLLCKSIGIILLLFLHFSALTLLVGWQEGHLTCKKTEWWGAGVVVCLEQGADLHMAQLMPLPLSVSCFSKIQIGVTFLVPAHLGSPGERAVKWVCVCVPPYRRGWKPYVSGCPSICAYIFRCVFGWRHSLTDWLGIDF